MSVKLLLCVVSTAAKMAVPQGQPGEGRPNTAWKGVVRGTFVRNGPVDVQGRGEGGRGHEVPQVSTQRFPCSLWRDHAGERRS